MAKFTLQELEEQFTDSFEKVYKEYMDNDPVVKEALEKDVKFRDKYFFNNGIKRIFELLHELEEEKKKNKE